MSINFSGYKLPPRQTGISGLIMHEAMQKPETSSEYSNRDTSHIDVTHKLTDYDPKHFKSFLGFTCCEKPPKEWKHKYRIPLQCISSVVDPEKPVIGKLTRLQQNVVGAYTYMLRGYIVDALLESKDRTLGSYYIVKEENYSDMAFKHGVAFVDNDKSLRLRESPIQHNGGCFNFSDGNTINIWIL